jgi:hypothetical protein
MTTKITLDMLTDKSVSVMTQRYVEEDGVEYPVGEPHRCSYINSKRGRADVATALEEPYLSAVMAMWGAEPSVSEAAEDDS